MNTVKPDHKERRVVVIQWKDNSSQPLEVFSNLKNFCSSYPAFSYNTLNNYLSKSKTAFENDRVRIERKNIISKVLTGIQSSHTRQLLLTVKKGPIKDLNQDENDLKYWLSRPIQERAAAVTTIISQSLQPGQRLDKSFLHKKTLHR